MEKNLSIIVPVYNEINAVDNCINSLVKIKNLDLGHNFEILIVDDGSTDGTTQLLKSIASKRQDIEVIFHQDNKGYGAAIKTGIAQASHDFIAITDSDDTYPNERLVEFLDQTIENGYDMLVGSRVGKNVHIPLLRRLPKKFLNLLENLMF